MGSTIDLTASDGFKFAAYRAEPAGKAKGGVVVVQEAFGVNAHIREMADRFAKDGYLERSAPKPRREQGGPLA
jgi:carboxymethylenebutenolidase